MAVSTRPGEFAGRNTLLPSAWLQVVVITDRRSKLWLEILELFLPILVKKPVKGLLVIGPIGLSVSRWLARTQGGSMQRTLCTTASGLGHAR